MGKQWANNNYCTLAPDKLFGKDISSFCYQHDVDYSEHKISRLQADIKLREGIASLGGIFKLISWFYYFAVRMYGGFYW